MRYVMRAYGADRRNCLPRNVTEIRLRATVPADAIKEARSRWDRHASGRRWRAYTVFDGRGNPLEFVDGELLD